MKNKLAAYCLLALFSAPFPARVQAQTNRFAGPGNGAALSAGSVGIKSINVSTPTTPEFQTSNGETQSKRYTLGKWLEVEVEFVSLVPAKELTFHYSIAIENTLFVGDVTHIDILPGQSLFSVMYIAPRTLTSLLRGAPLLPTSVQNIDVQILRPGVAAPLAEKMLHPGPPFYSTMQQVPNMVLNKNQTPFANLWWDRYEVIKPAAQ